MRSRTLKKCLMLASASLVHVVGYLLVNAYAAKNGLSYDVALPWDQHIPFIKYFSPFYSVVYLFPLVTFFLLWKDGALMSGFYRAFIGAGLISLGIFAVFPVEFRLRATLQPPYDFFENLVRFFYWADNPPYNCIPSLHVALAVISARAIQLRQKSWAPWFYFLAAMITLSTLFIRQHYLLDLAAGLALSVAMIILFLPRRLGRAPHSGPCPARPGSLSSIQEPSRYSR
jgi:PAP2 superfamily.